MAAAGEVGLQDFTKQIPFQQAVGHGQKLLDNLVKILEKVGDPKISAFLSNYDLSGFATFWLLFGPDLFGL